MPTVKLPRAQGPGSAGLASRPTRTDVHRDVNHQTHIESALDRLSPAHLENVRRYPRATARPYHAKHMIARLGSRIAIDSSACPSLTDRQQIQHGH
jgi:hypothetical protein